ncbi:MAG: hypothetical protein LBD94_01450 [Rickettsiales bacterium]|jgi:phosphate butyryltransferase|nr:hypothetical protein [Rickettsiales bacterium]
MNGISLLVVGADEHYMRSVAAKALDRKLIDEAKFAEPDMDSFANAMKFVDKNNLIIAKGMVETADFLRLILKYNDKGLIVGGKDGFLSHCAILIKKRKWLFAREKPIILTDAALNIAPDAAEKVKIAKNAIDLARRALGLKRPVLAILTAAGKYNPAIKSSVDGQYVIDNLGGENAELRLDQVDTAIDAASRRVKNLNGGTADILLSDSIESGQMGYKFCTKKAGYEAIGFLCGAIVPIVVTSRGDSARSKLLSIKYAAKMIRQQR